MSTNQRPYTFFSSAETLPIIVVTQKKGPKGVFINDVIL